RNISVGQTPTMTLSLTVGRRYPELSGFERAYFSFYQYIVRRHPHNSLLVYPDTSIPSSDMISDFEKDVQSFNSIDSQSSLMDQIKANFGQNADGAFFTIDPETENVTGPTKDRLISITGDSGSSSKDGKPMDT